MQFEHDDSKKRFLLNLDDGECYIDYQMNNKGVFDLQHTWTSHDQRGNGLARELVSNVCEWMVGNRKTFIPSCSYIKAFVDKHPQYQSQVA